MEIDYNQKTKMNKGYPKIRKLGAVSPYGEMTPFVFHEKLMRLELIDVTRGLNPFDENIYACIRDVASGKIISRFGHGCYYFSGYSENDVFYVLGTKCRLPDFCGDTIIVFESKDLLHWTSRELIRKEGWNFFNTSLCKGKDGYVLTLESNTQPYAGEYPFTCFFATSKDMKSWNFMDPEKGFPKTRYCGGPYMRYVNGYYYLFCVTELPGRRYTNYLYRTKDFTDWEAGKYNPFLMPSEEDKSIAPHCADFTPEFLEEIKTGFNSNNSDVDMCEFGGRTVIDYIVGNQLGFYYMAEAVYDGTIRELLENFFD